MYIYVYMCGEGGIERNRQRVYIYAINIFAGLIVKNILQKCCSIRYYMVALSVVEEGTLYFCVCAYSLIYFFNTPLLEYNCFTTLC